MAQDVEFIKWLEDHEAWYEKHSTRWSVVLNTCKILSVFASIISIVFAAASPEAFFAGIGRWVIVASSSLTAIASEVLSQLKVREMEDLREEGNLEISEIARQARLKLEHYAGDPAKLYAIKEEISNRVADLDRRQHRRDVAIGAPKAARTRP
jgi:hypothetical protein